MTEAADTTTPDRPPVYLVDDDAAVRTGFTALLEAAGREVHAFGDWDAFVEHRDKHRGPAILLLDIRLGRRNGLELYAGLAEAGLAPPVIFMTAYADVPTAVGALRLSATDFLEKPCSGANLFAAIARAEAELRQKDAAGGTADDTEVAQRYRSLSPRETEVFAAMAAGETTKMIARRLGISPRTVEVHRSRVMQKMGTDSLASLVRMAVALKVPADPM